MAAWTLPNDGPLTDDQRRQAMDNFNAYRKRVDLTHTEVAQQVGSPKTTTIGDLSKGIFRENADDHIRRLNNWVEQHAKQQAVKLRGKHVDTVVAKAINDACRLVKESETMGMVVGPTGIGKTWCAEALAAKYTGAFLVTVRTGCSSPRGFVAAVARKLGVYNVVTGSRRKLAGLAMIDRVIETLRGSSRLILVDEAHKLSDEALETLRELHDETNCPVFCLATKDLADRVDRSADPDHGQLRSRFDIQIPLTQGRDVRSKGGKPLFSVDDIRKLYEVPPIKLSTDAARYLCEVANLLGHGSLRRCRQLVINGARRARRRQSLNDEESVTVTADDLAYIAEKLRPSMDDVELSKAQRAAASAAPIAASA